MQNRLRAESEPKPLCQPGTEVSGLRITTDAMPYWALRARFVQKSAPEPDYVRESPGFLTVEFRGLTNIRPKIPFRRLISRVTDKSVQIKLEASEPVVNLLIPDGPGVLSLTVHDHTLKGAIDQQARVSILRQDESPDKSVTPASDADNARDLNVESFRNKVREAGIGGEIGERLLKLAPREIEVLERLLGGKKDIIIARELGISQSTAATWRNRINYRVGGATIKETLGMLRKAGVDSKFWSAS